MLAGFRSALSRYRYDIVAWAIAASIAATGSVVAIVASAPPVAIVAAALAGAVRLVLEIGRRQRTAPHEDELRRAARTGVAAAAIQVREHTLWHDEEASRRLREILIQRRLGHDEPWTMPYVPSRQWSVGDAADKTSASFDIRAHPAGDWLSVAAELRKARDAFAAAVGPYVVDLGVAARALVAECLAALADAADAADNAFHILYSSEAATDTAIGAASAELHKMLVRVDRAAAQLVSSAPGDM